MATPTANLRDGILTLSFPDAVTPTFWQLSPSDFSVMGFAIRGADKMHEITMATDADTPRTLAQYNDGGAAQDALAVVLKAVQGRCGTCTTPSRSGGFFRGLLRWILRLIFLGLLLWVGYMAWMIFSPVTNTAPEDATAPVAQSTPTPPPQAVTAPPAPTGVPLSADDVLGQ